MTIRIATTQLWQLDQDAAVDFYTRKVGWEIREDVTLPEMGNFRWVSVAPPGGQDTQVVLCHSGLAQRAQGIAPDAVVVPFQLFMGDPAFDRVEAAIRDGGTLGG